jgi:hypothetical protein
LGINVGNAKDSFCEELLRVFIPFPKYNMKILLEDFNSKLGREDFFKPTVGNKILHQDGNDNGVRIVNSATSKI